MPLLWRNALIHYLKVFALGAFALITLLLISRLEEIAKFAAIGANGKTIALFAFCQVPTILPIALPIASLVAAWLFFQRLSDTQELTALRASGLSLRQILTPILSVALLGCCFNGWIASEVATRSHLKTREMLFAFSSVNPLVLLQKAKIALLDEAVSKMDLIECGKRAKNLVLATNQKANERLALIVANEVTLKNQGLVISDFTCISSLENDGFDTLVIENQKKAETSAAEFAFLLRKKGWKIANDHLAYSLLRARRHLLKQKNNADSRGRINKCDTELIRRISLALAAFTFPLIGAALAISVGRHRSARHLWITIALSAFTLICYFAAKTFAHLFFVASGLFLIPHLIIIAVSSVALINVQRGIEA